MDRIDHRNELLVKVFCGDQGPKADDYRGIAQRVKWASLVVEALMCEIEGDISIDQWEAEQRRKEEAWPV